MVKINSLFEQIFEDALIFKIISSSGTILHMIFIMIKNNSFVMRSFMDVLY